MHEHEGNGVSHVFELAWISVQRRVLGAIDVDKSISDCRNFSRNRLGITPDAAVECSD